MLLDKKYKLHCLMPLRIPRTREGLFYAHNNFVYRTIPLRLPQATIFILSSGHDLKIMIFVLDISCSFENMDSLYDLEKMLRTL